MDLAKRRVRKFSNRGYFIIFFVAVLIVWIVFFSGLIKKDCKQDSDCFNEALSECKPVKFLNVNDNNLYQYKVSGSKGNLCDLNIKLIKMGVGTPIDLVQKFEGKSMRCLVPKSEVETGDLAEIGNVLNYCSGPLKESILELIIDRMYGLIIKNLGQIAEEVKTNIFDIN